MKQKPAQTLMEYVILTSVVILVVVLFSGDFFKQLTGNNGAFQNHFANMQQRMGVR